VRCALVALLLLSSACAVRPWERGRLSRRDMSPGAHTELDAGEEHARSYREGSRGGGGLQVGGCGCN
jgi:hypothetical protein